MMTEKEYVEKLEIDIKELREQKTKLISVCRGLINMITNNELHGKEIDTACAAIARAESK